MYMVSVYCKYAEGIEPYITYLEALTERFRNECLLIGMDANAISPLWFSKGREIHRGRSNAQRALSLEEYIVGSRMRVLNQPSEWYTFSGPTGQSDIDLTLSNPMCDMYEFEWTVLPECGTSDHNAIRIKIRYVVRELDRTDPPIRWSTVNVNWEEYVADLSSLAENVTNFSQWSVEQKIGRIYSWLSEVNRRRLRQVKRVNPHSVPWFTPELRIMRTNVRRLRKSFQRNRRRGTDGDAWLRFNNARLVYRKAMMAAKELHWRNFVGNTGNENPWGSLYKFCRGRGRATEIGSLNVNGVYTESYEQSANVLMSEFFPEADPEDRSGTIPRADFDPTPPSWEEINEAVYQCGPKKAPGLDGMNGELARAVWRALPDHLVSLYSQCISEGHFPADWKIGDVIVLLKSPDKIRTDPRSYRPICLLAVLGKVLERMMVRRLCDRKPPVNVNQFGFTVGRSTEDAWLKLRRGVTESDKKYVLGIFVDFKGAFDNISWGRILSKIYNIGCAEAKLWTSYFTDRKACMRNANGTVWRVVERGCPQGSICGPTVWNMLLDDLLTNLDRLGCKFVAYADDLLLIVEGDTRTSLERLGNQYLQEVENWGGTVGVNVSDRKTVSMLLKGKLSRDRPPILRTTQGRIKYVVETKYLGISVGERMCFKPHLTMLRGKIIRVVGSFRRVLRKEWGLKGVAVRMLFRGLFVPCMMYGAIVWYDMTRYQYAREAINRCQRVVLLACLKVCRTVSTDALQVLSGELPWDLMVKNHAMLLKFKKSIAPVEGDIVTNSEFQSRTYAQVRVLLTEKVNVVWQRRWNESNNGRVTYGFISDVCFANEFGVIDFCLELGYLLTGHGSLNEFLLKRALANTAECLCGYSREDWEHVLCDCVIYNDLRRLDEWGITQATVGWNVGSALCTRERVLSLNEFARGVFARRSSLLAAG